MTQQVRSKQRVADHGEVFTAEREVNAMLDLVKQETERIDSRFLEPACGDGNFLAEILRRKLAVVQRVSTPPKRKKIDPMAYEFNAFVAATSVYGIDILLDNVEECRRRLFAIWDEAYTKNCGRDANDQCRDAVRYVLDHNILCGNALTLEKVDNQGKDTGEPIIFAEWSRVMGTSIKRRDFRLDGLMRDEKSPANDAQLSMFQDQAGEVGWEMDAQTHQRIPKPIREFAPIDYRRVYQQS